MKFGNLTEEILEIQIRVLDDETLSLREMIEETTDENIISARYVVSANEHGLDIVSFSADTRSSLLTLIYTPFGGYMIATKKQLD